VRVRAFLIGLAAAGACAAAPAASEHERRLAAELVVMAGDARRLTLPGAGPLETTGLVGRLSGALSSLPMLLRRANLDDSAVAGLRALVARRDWPVLATALTALQRRHPFEAGRLLGRVTPAAATLGKSIHQSTCAGCHDAPAADSLLPAKPLDRQLAGMPREEFAARLWLGVRGDKMTSYVNPFSDAELAALIAWYSQGRDGDSPSVKPVKQSDRAQ
jgi:mono/diheme cytochrome c family protein